MPTDWRTRACARRCSQLRSPCGWSVRSTCWRLAWTARLGPGALSPLLPVGLLAARHRYGAFLPHWWAAFPREQLLILRLEDVKKAPYEHIQATLDFLGLRKMPDLGRAQAAGGGAGKQTAAGATKNQKQ